MDRIKVVLLLLVMLSMNACKSPEESYIDGFESFVEKVESEANRFSDEEWGKCDARFSDFVGEKYNKVKGKLSSDDKKKVGELIARYCKARAKTTGKQILDFIESGKNIVDGFTGEMINEFDIY